MPLAGKVIVSFHKGADFCRGYAPGLLCLAVKINMESHGNTDARVTRGIVVGIAVAVDNSGVGRIAAPSGNKPPVGAGTPRTDN